MIKSLWLYFLFTSFLNAQTLDKILAVVDEEIILESDLENQVNYLKKMGEKDEDGTLRCFVFENMLTSKLLLAKARLDSLKVSDEQIENELNRRLNLFIMQSGGEAEFEKMMGKSILQFKIELRPKIKEQLLIEQQKNKITENVQVTPKEIRQFFNQIPPDSLPFLPAEVEVYQIVIVPKPSEESKEKAKAKLKNIKNQILAGSSFEDMAKFYSEDIESARLGGSLGEFKKGQMVPEFEEVVFSLKEGEISEVFETQYGFHIVKLHKMMGDRAKASHILITPEKTPEDDEKALKKLQAILQEIKDSTKFEVAAAKYSDDPQTKMFGGLIINPQTGEPRIPIDQLDPEIYLTIDKMKEGEISEPKEFYSKNPKIGKAYHIVYLKKKYPPHVSNLETDYTKFKQAALEAKKLEVMEKWFQKAKEQVFIDIKDPSCSQALENWK